MKNVGLYMSHKLQNIFAIYGKKSINPLTKSYTTKIRKSYSDYDFINLTAWIINRKIQQIHYK